jgi:uncharacterized protein YhbP (UPF0306 family)
MSVDELTVARVLDAARGHLAQRHVCTFATSHRDVPWAASAFYVARDFDVFTCQRKDARTLAQMQANPRTAFAVDDRKAEAWLQALGTARPASPDEEAWARAALQRAASEFTRHFSNPEYPVLAVHVEEFTFVDRAAGIIPRRRLVREGDQWRFA